MGGRRSLIYTRSVMAPDCWLSTMALAVDPIHLAHSFQSTRLAAVGSATILLYDHLITIDQEIDLVWRKDWSLLKGVFIFHRYLGLACVLIELYAILNTNVSQSVSTFWFHWEMWAYTVVVLTTELVLLLWIFVIYNRNVQILAALGVLFVAEMVSVIVILAQSFPRLRITATYAPVDSGLHNFCSLFNPPDFFYWYWLPVLIYNTAILALFIGKSAKAFRVLHTPEINVVDSLYRRSLVNFLAIFAVFFLCCMFWIVGDFSLGQIPVGFALSFSITNSTRLLINIRHAYYSQEEMDLDRPSAPTIYANQAPPEEWLFELRALKLR
ncbi:hypothetical protein DFH08DRAFT_6715 [Mycena albidolilacea]|uniref:DUF6533 domain-containing protein n=1 Tax=Mycena albidolilacea TaxID=1033008 RepID=A0AAD7F5U6_9AGAR|nr:hypothetical protein DFH08DRAFT_6715 [Mycena albidolilacea]